MSNELGSLPNLDSNHSELKFYCNYRENVYKNLTHLHIEFNEKSKGNKIHKKFANFRERIANAQKNR